MRRTASEVIRDLERRIARLERSASSKITVTINTGGPRNKKESMSVKEIFSMAESKASLGGRCVANIIPDGMNGSKVNLICPATHWSCSFDMFDLIEAIKADHRDAMEALIMNANVIDEEDADEMAFAVQDWLRTSRGSFGGDLGRDWLIEII